MDQDPASADLWTVDKVLLKPGVAVDLLNRRSARETELLRKISDLTDEIRTLKAPKTPAAAPAKTIEDYAMVIAGGLAGYFGKVQRTGNDTQSQADAKWCFERAQSMVAEAQRRKS